MKIFNKVSGLIVVLTMLLLLLMSVSCMNGSDQSATGTENGQVDTNTQNGDEVQIEMINFKFNPDMVTIKQGTTVTWVNKDGVAHTVISGVRDNKSGLFDSGNISSGGTFSYTFNEKGTFDYFCEPHSGMDGTIVVE
jgi:plastocyanin